MKKNSILIPLLFIISFIYNETFCQVLTPGDNITLELADLALIATNSSTISLALQSTVPGESLKPDSNSTLFLRISSLVPTGKTRKITARVSGGAIPSGTQLSLSSASCTTSNSAGQVGTAITTPILLNTLDQNLITGIGSCYTGTGSTDGYQLTFKWSLSNITNYGQIISSSYNVVISFTITAAE